MSGAPRGLPRRLLDVAVVIPLLVLVLVGTHESAEHQSNLVRDLDAVGYVLAVLAAVSVVRWRAAPLEALLVCGAVTATYLGVGYPWGPVVVPLALLAFAAAWRVPTDRSLGPAAVVLALLLGGMVGRFAQDPGTGAAVEIVTAPGWFAVPFAIGLALRTRRDAAERDRRAEAERAIAAERLRIAADVHDVAGHGLAVIAMQAGVALHVLERRPEQARIALEEIRSTSTEALDGLRATLDSLRAPGDGSPLNPGLPGLGDLPALAERISRAGVAVRLEPSGVVGSVPPAVDHVAYRVVQEALTNVLRHADADRAWVETAWGPTSLTVRVHDDGRAAAGPEGGGITGMRSRVQAAGGTLRAGPLPAGGFEVVATLPVEAP